jgi:hypothetical protein
VGPESPRARNISGRPRPFGEADRPSEFLSWRLPPDFGKRDVLGSIDAGAPLFDLMAALDFSQARATKINPAGGANVRTTSMAVAW